jgi:hypothetical protein
MGSPPTPIEGRWKVSPSDLKTPIPATPEVSAILQHAGVHEAGRGALPDLSLGGCRIYIRSRSRASPAEHLCSSGGLATM